MGDRSLTFLDIGFGCLCRSNNHYLRHPHATLLLEAHVDITVVSRRLGHAHV